MLVEKTASNLEIYELNTGVYIKESKMFEVDVDTFEPEYQTDRFEIEYRVYFIQLFVWGMIV